MRKIFNLALMAALLGGLSLSVTSCSDDDDDKLTDEQKAEQQAEKSNKFWSVVSSLTDQYDADYADKTYTPTIGVQDETDATTRIVYTNDVATAAQRFNYITGAAIDENTSTYEWSDDEVGTLTYTRTNDGASWARVDVSIKQMPSLRHIVYKAPTQGENGSFNGTAYYRFGDVVSRQVDGQTEYWVCIRPAFGPEGKGESHWACLNALPSENVYHYHSNTNNYDYYLPTKLGTNKEQMQNLAEMMYAIYMPKSWQENITYYSEDGFFGPKGLRLFHDFHEANLVYHTQYFWQRVKEGWQQNDIYQKVFNATESQVNSQVPVGIHLLYNGYSWWTLSSWTCQLWEATYTNGSEKTELNLHKAYYDDKLKKDVKSIKFDCRTMGANTENYKQFFAGDNNLRWCFRTKTGEQLSSTGKTNVYEPLAGVTEVWNYNKYYNIPANKDEKPEELTTGPNNKKETWNTNQEYTGMPHFRWGDLYKDEEDNIWYVASMSGIADEEIEPYSERSPYAELICFTGIKTSADKRYATNLPTRDQAIRGYYWLDMLFTNTTNDKTDVNLRIKDKPTGYTYVLKVLIDNMDTEPRIWLQRISAQDGDPRNDTQALSVPYQSNDGKQRLLRIVQDIQNEKRDPVWYIWDHYPKVPLAGDPRTLVDTLFSKDHIYLEDIASADMIGLHNIDWYVTQPLSAGDGWVENPNQPARTPRGVGETDPRGLDITTCFYNRQTWLNRTFTTDMWREPVFPIRVTACYDRGDSDYATLTVDGHHLRPYKLADLSYIDKLGDLVPDEEGWVDHVRVLGAALNSLDDNLWFLDGKSGAWPSWRVWNQ